LLDTVFVAANAREGAETDEHDEAAEVPRTSVPHSSERARTARKGQQLGDLPDRRPARRQGAVYIRQVDEPGGLHFTQAQKGTIYAVWATVAAGIPMVSGGRDE
jgi:hypothetical protein